MRNRKTAWRHSKLSPEKQLILEYAIKIEELAKEAPDSFTAHFLRKIINSLRIRYAMPESKKRQAILNAIGKSQARTVEEIAEDLGLSEEMVLETLNNLERNKQVVSVRPMVKTNQKRRKIPLSIYYLTSEVSPSAQSVS